MNIQLILDIVILLEAGIMCLILLRNHRRLKKIDKAIKQIIQIGREI